MYTTLIFLGLILFPIPAILQSIRKGQNPYIGVLDGVFSVGFGSVMIFIFAAIGGEGIAVEIETAMKDSLAMMADSLGDQAALYMNAIDIASMMFPSMILITGALTSYVEYLILSKFVKNNGQGAWQMGPFREFTWPRNGIYGWLLIFILSWIVGSTGIQGGNLLLINIENIFETAFALQGTSLLLMFFHMKKFPKSVGILLALACWLIPYGKSILFLAGIADIMLGLRGRIPPR